jgi:flagellar L-ring protein FlgH
MKNWTRLALLLSFAAWAWGSSAQADDLYDANQWAHVAGDRRASQRGDVLTVLVYQAAEARNAAQNSARQGRRFEGSIVGGALNESGELTLDGAYSGQGEVRRSETFITQISVTVENVAENGDLLVAGQQTMNVNGERTLVRLSGRVRPIDVDADNQVLSSRLADARISYDGQGFVSRNARPNLVNRLLAMLGLGG